MTHSHNLWYTDVHFPARECSSRLLDMLEDTVYVVEVLPSELTNPSIFGNNIKMITI